MTRSCFERHTPQVWRRTAQALEEESATGTTTGVNKNGAPLLGDSRDLFRPKTSDIPTQPGVYSGGMATDGSSTWARPKTCATV